MTVWMDEDKALARYPRNENGLLDWHAWHDIRNTMPCGMFVAEVTEEEAPLVEKVEEKQEARREILSSRKLRWGIAFILCTIPALAVIIATIVVGLKNFGAPDTRYLIPTIILGAVSLVLFVAFMIITNKYINAGRMYRKNERLSSTEDGLRVLEIRAYKELYEALLAAPVEETEEADEE
jgi:hypothetical protein